jgi:hypothetical protein
MNQSMDTKNFGKSLLLTGEYQINALKTQQIAMLQSEVSDKNKLAEELARAKAALAQANELVADWQSAMEAWKDLAITLREEIKACPNHEAHKFGKADKEVLVEHMNKKEDEERVKRKLKPKYKK